MKNQPTRHAAIVGVSTDLLLRLMEFHNGGIIHRAYTEDEWLEPNIIYLVIEHPDLPAVPISEKLPKVMITLHTTYGENGVPVKIERTDPPKKEKRWDTVDIRKELPEIYGQYDQPANGRI